MLFYQNGPVDQGGTPCLFYFKMDVIFGDIVLTHGFIYKMVHRLFLWAGQILHNCMLLCENYESVFEYIIFWFEFPYLSPDSQNFLKPLV